MRVKLFLGAIAFALCFWGLPVIASATTISLTTSSGMTSSFAGAQTTSFNSSSTTNPPTGFTFNCNSGSKDCGYYSASTSIVDVVKDPTGNLSNDYIATGDSGQSISMNIGSLQTALGIPTINYFGLYWGSVDTYNHVDFYDGSTLVGSFSGLNVKSLDPSLVFGTTSVYVNFFISGGPITKIVLWSGGENFETLNEAFADPPTSVPEPATLPLLGLGLLGLAAVAICRARRTA